jgi:hypothetical protein
MSLTILSPFFARHCRSQDRPSFAAVARIALETVCSGRGDIGSHILSNQDFVSENYRNYR